MTTAEADSNPFMPKLMRRGLRSHVELGASRSHGDRLRYMAGCKCFKCRRANSDYERARQAARLAGDWNGIIDAAPARRHLRKLSRLGVGQWAVCHATDIARSIIHEIKNGDRLRIRARTARKILACTPQVRSDASIVSAVKTWRLLQQLLDEGYTKTALAKKMGLGPAIQFRKDWVLARTEARVVALHSKLTT